jgi:hypothetical protein
MSDQLRELYQAKGKLENYFDDATPVDLWRGQKQALIKQRRGALYPELAGFPRRDGTFRIPDIQTFTRDSDGAIMVRGCRCVAGEGDYRGVSTFDVRPDLGKSFSYFQIPGGTLIPEALAVTKDAFNRRFGGYHYTVAPKDDMPLSLFLVWLGAIEASMKAEGSQ